MAKLKRLGVIKTACFLGLYGVFIGLIFGILFFFILGSVYRSSTENISFDEINSLSGYATMGMSSIFSSSGILTYLIIFPLICGILLFLIGLIFTPIMNFVLKIINGIDLDIEIQNPVQQQVAYPQNQMPSNYIQRR